jgi:hypothetical protein
MSAALTAPEARKIYQLRLAHAAGRLDDDEAVELACRTMLSLWPDSALVNFRAAESLVEITLTPGTAIIAARRAHALGSAPAGSSAPDEAWLASQEERALDALRKLMDRAVKERHADSWSRVAYALDAFTAGWQEDLSRGRREAVIRKWLQALDAPPFTGIRAPGDCPGLPDGEHERWRRAWAAVDALAGRARAPDSR